MNCGQRLVQKEAHVTNTEDFLCTVYACVQLAGQGSRGSQSHFPGEPKIVKSRLRKASISSETLAENRLIVSGSRCSAGEAAALCSHPAYETNMGLGVRCNSLTRRWGWYKLLALCSLLALGGALAERSMVRGWHWEEKLHFVIVVVSEGLYPWDYSSGQGLIPGESSIPAANRCV